AAELSAGAGDCGAAFDGDVFSANDVFARRARRLAEVAHRIFFRSGGVDWGGMAGLCDDHRCDGHQSFAAKRHGADQHAHAVDDGGRRLLAGGVFRAAPALRHAVDRHHCLLDYLRAAGAENDGAALDRVRVAAHRGNRADGAGIVAIAQDAAGFAAAVPHSLWAASFAPKQVAAAAAWPAKPAAKYMPSICRACGITSIVKSRVPPQTNSTFRPRSRGYTAIMPRRRISALRRTVFSVSGKNAARPPKSMRLSGVSR